MAPHPEDRAPGLARCVAVGGSRFPWLPGTELKQLLVAMSLSELEPWLVKRDAVRYCNAMVKDQHMESRGTGYQVVAAFVDQAQAGLLTDVKRWLTRTCGNGGLVDNLAPSVLAPLLDRHPELIPEVVDWTAPNGIGSTQRSTRPVTAATRRRRDPDRSTSTES